MKIDEINILRIRSQTIINPKRDWVVILSVSFLILVMFLIFDYILFNKVNSGSMFIDVNSREINIERLSVDKLNQVIKDFDNKAFRLTQIKKGIIVDPSL